MAVDNITYTGAEPVTGLDLLTCLFIGLKLTDTIDWSWWWVLAPAWAPLAFAALVIFVVKLFDR